MTASMGRAGMAAVAGLALAAGLSGCAEVREHQGYVVDRSLVASVEPGVDTRDSVQATLGDPSFASQFDDGTWYYVSRSTKQFSFGLPKPVSQLTLAVHFDKAGNVTSVDRTGLELAANIHPVADKTPTLGRKRSLFQELFGNIGAVGSAGMNAPTADNPTGGGSGV
ncbi:outer membrane protein assembly factor BamE [Sphingomonas sp. CGMCC 1.13654]|uniref:Outer membrane protein assembly factor BamE n=1 Tax=Sphingomonas chungangi TaxID=2683589 RepID=A0A838LA26_9SPHN|nr:outer membrane protein assembly factor BamE [Sphingomonas chungangi]MBA2935429.1 outer membrane protein assembly factor BamE [Sphingomonas chungangi]MVW56936.1 outer membrane protein assembly factor BamE [Sphingomonas chungangi]